DHIRRACRDHAATNGQARQARAERVPECERDQRTERLEVALQRLRPEEREVLFLHVVAGLSVREITRVTRKPRGTILSLLQRGRNKLREQVLAHGVEVG
ncbi:MAG: RNA polymerase sigma factor, partial [Planctomycetota bacterium]